MAIPPGVTLICGGGYHGKSTLLDAIASGIYNHVPGDGRELVVTSRGAIKIRAEDGRRIERVSIDPFISNLPRGRDTLAFSSDDASGSTSQAANIVEALEAGADLLLIDEDTSATNFMIRDHRMQELIAKEHEPITPFIDRVRQLSSELGVSTILVIGGSGDYFDVADRVVAMREYEPEDVTAHAREIAQRHQTERATESGGAFGPIAPRAPVAESIDPSRGRRAVKTRSRGVKTIDFGTEQIDLAAVDHLVDSSQLNTIAEALVRLHKEADGRASLADLLRTLFGDGHAPALVHHRTGRLAAVRPLEVAAALNRLRTLEVRQV
jgi:predicted ABC-class ATPase